MAFPDYEGSRDGGNPIQLFRFVYGTDPSEYYGYTDHTEELTAAGYTYAPVPIARNNIESNGTLDKSALKITTDIGTDLAEIFRVYPPSYVVNLTIFQRHIEDPDAEYMATWVGRIVAASRQGSELVMTGEPISTSMRRPGLRATYGRGCRHVLYGPQCGANKAAATVSATVASISGATVTLNAGWEGAFDPTKFQRGMLEWPAAGGSTERRSIIRVTGDTLSLSGIPNGLAASDAVDVVLGCNHKAYAADGGDCQPLHNRINSYGGAGLYIPEKNPIGPYNNYY